MPLTYGMVNWMKQMSNICGWIESINEDGTHESLVLIESKENGETKIIAVDPQKVGTNDGSST